MSYLPQPSNLCSLLASHRSNVPEPCRDSLSKIFATVCTLAVQVPRMDRGGGGGGGGRSHSSFFWRVSLNICASFEVSIWAPGRSWQWNVCCGIVYIKRAPYKSSEWTQSKFWPSPNWCRWVVAGITSPKTFSCGICFPMSAAYAEPAYSEK